MHGQCDDRPTATFPANDCHHPLLLLSSAFTRCYVFSHSAATSSAECNLCRPVQLGLQTAADIHWPASIKLRCLTMGAQLCDEPAQSCYTAAATHGVEPVTSHHSARCTSMPSQVRAEANSSKSDCYVFIVCPPFEFQKQPADSPAISLMILLRQSHALTPLTSVRSLRCWEASEQSTIGTRDANVDSSWNVIYKQPAIQDDIQHKVAQKYHSTFIFQLHCESKKWCHPIHGYNFANSWSICKILSLL